MKMKTHRKKFLTPVDVVRREYSKPATVHSFSKVGFWDAEEILIDRYFNKGESVIDIACGAGRTAIPLAQKGFKVTGIDFLPEMLETAHKLVQQYNVRVEFLLMDAIKMTFPDESFHNVVFLYNSFELIWGKANRTKLLRDIYRILKPEGYFFLTSRSSYAFGKRWIAWPWSIVRTCLLKALRIGNPYLELGDVFSRGTYHRYQSPFSIWKNLKKVGFVYELFNSKGNLEQNKKPNFFTNFSADKSLFFIARKPDKNS